VAQLYELRITASGEVRDKDGNLKSTEPVEAVTIVTAEQAAAILASDEGELSWPSD
jgi:hypothetical protein